MLVLVQIADLKPEAIAVSSDEDQLRMRAQAITGYPLGWDVHHEGEESYLMAETADGEFQIYSIEVL